MAVEMHYRHDPYSLDGPVRFPVVKTPSPRTSPRVPIPGTPDTRFISESMMRASRSPSTNSLGHSSTAESEELSPAAPRPPLPTPQPAHTSALRPASGAPEVSRFPHPVPNNASRAAYPHPGFPQAPLGWARGGVPPLGYPQPAPPQLQRRYVHYYGHAAAPVVEGMLRPWAGEGFTGSVAPGVAIPTPLPPALYFPCFHFPSWKRIRAKKGVNHYSCSLCGIRWKGSRFYMQFITRPAPGERTGDDAEAAADGVDDETLCEESHGMSSSPTI